MIDTVEELVEEVVVLGLQGGSELDAGLEGAAPRFDAVDPTDTGFAALQAAITAIGDKAGRDKFAREFTGVEALWEFLAPDPVLDAHKADYTWLAKVYEAIKPTGVSNDLLWARLGAKTLNLVHGHISKVAVTGTGLEEVVVDPEAIKALKEMIEKGQIDPPGGVKGRDLVDDPLTLDDVLDTIEARIKRRLESSGGHPVYKSLAEQIEKLRSQAMQRSEDSIEFLKKALQVAKTAVEAERMEDAGELDEGAEALLDPNIGALTQIVRPTPAGATDGVQPADTFPAKATTGPETDRAVGVTPVSFSPLVDIM